MPTYKVWMADGRVASIPAPDGAAALRAAQTWAAQNPVPTTPGGLAKSFGSGVVNGVTGLGNLLHPGGDPDYVDLAQRGGQWLAQHVGGQSPAQAQAGYDAVSAARRGLLGPTSTEAQQAVHLYHAPQNEPERIADVLGAFVPNAFLGGGGWAARGARVAVPASTSEGARYATEKAGGGPLAQTLAALAGGVAGNAFVHPRVTGSLLPSTPAARAIAADGVPLTWGQQMGGVAKMMEDRALDLPLAGPAVAGARARGLEAFNRVAANVALAPLNKTLPAEIPVGRPMLDYIRDAYKAATTAASANIGKVAWSPEIERNLDLAIQKFPDAPAEVKAGSAKSTRDYYRSIFDKGRISGERAFEVQHKMDEIARNTFLDEDDDVGEPQGLLFKQKNDQLTDYIDMQYPGFAADKRALDTTRNTLRYLSGALARTDGSSPVFTPQNLSDAIEAAKLEPYPGADSPGLARLKGLVDGARASFGSDLDGGDTPRRTITAGGLMAGLAAPAVAAKPAAALGLAAVPYQLMNRNAAETLARAAPLSRVGPTLATTPPAPSPPPNVSAPDLRTLLGNAFRFKGSGPAADGAVQDPGTP